MFQRAGRSKRGHGQGVLLLSAVLAFMGIAIACGSGSGGGQVTPTSEPTVDVSGQEPVGTVETPDGERPMRWGFNPLQATGIDDEPVREEPLPDGYRIERVVGGLDRPTHVDVLPDGRLLIAEQAGAIRVVDAGELLAEPLLSVNVYLPEAEGVIELGLTGIVVDPEFEEHPYLYAYYTADNPRRSVVGRARIVAGRAGEFEEIFSWEAAPECCHVGGGMQFLPDGTLLLGMGDHQSRPEAQNSDTPPGSILRMNRDGTLPEDNPFLSTVYAYGLRNPYDVAVDPATGRIFAGENGFFAQDALVVIEAGANYGWPGKSLSVPREEIAEPLIFYHSASGIAGLEFYSSNVLSEFQGRLFFCRFHSATVHSVRFNEDGSVAEETIVAEPCHSDIVTGPEGYLYFLDYVEGVLHRIAADES